MKQSPRSKKFATTIRQQLPQCISAVLTPNQVGLLTVTAVEVSGDLRHAAVYVTSLKAPKRYISTLNKSMGRIREMLQRKVKLVRSLDIIFYEDGGKAHGMWAEEIMQ